ncbi:DsrE family protein [Thiohalorhabdus sp. Cl-TMA]|uniref:DsrE family protein n=1 Tax=Thiohalorhabdus methylotrophus TaxID=3242694 RepID=A0ABV4TYX2_9GAMM
MKKIVLAVTGLLMGLVLSASAGAQMGMDGPKPKVVFHVDYPGVRRFSGQLTSVYNMVHHYRNQLIDYDVRIVANSFGVRYFTDKPLENTPFEAGKALRERREDLRGRVKSLMSTYDVQVAICDITREQLGISKDAFYEGVTFVESGVVEVAKLQQKGFAYIKAE